MTIKQLMELGVTKVRKSCWIDPDTHIVLTKLYDESYSVWCNLVPGPQEASELSRAEIEALDPLLVATITDDDFEELK